MNAQDGPAAPEHFKPRCLCIDLEVGPQSRRIRQFAAIRADTGTSLRYDGGDLAAALAKLDALAEGAAFVLGHNVIAHDLPHLAAAKPDLGLLHLPAVDTLRLNPLAFPRNPYHHLVKHYQDGPLQGDRVNDPEQDARLTLDLFRDQRAALRQCQQENPDLLLAWHGLTTPSMSIAPVGRRRPAATGSYAMRSAKAGCRCCRPETTRACRRWRSWRNCNAWQRSPRTGTGRAAR
ncbi:MAG TPA: hypothetical protein VNK45_05295 [Candidatus Acidoferrales bacterium]|nr:hypothetical protein [Candidatus Acidoferrales bacterium]